MDIENRYGEKIKCKQCGKRIELNEFTVEKVGTNTYVVYCENGCEFILN